MSNVTIKVRANKRNRTFTIREYIGSECLGKYRTIPCTNDEFIQLLANTEDDWRAFMNLCIYDYYSC